jgi:hypothetical protein
MRPYVVRQGDYLTKIAHAVGGDPMAIWQHPRNAALRAKRSSPEILHPGDIVYLPDPGPGCDVRAGTSNRFRGALPTVPVRLRLRDESGSPIAAAAFVVRGVDAEIHGTTDGEGALRIEVPITARQVSIELVESGRRYRVLVGDMDPVSEPSGVWKRLRHLGYLASRHIGPGGAYGGPLSRAISQFQVDSGLPATGRIDQATRDALVAAHGS